MADDTSSTDRRIDRRTLLATVGGVGATALAGCGGDGDDSNTDTPTEPSGPAPGEGPGESVDGPDAGGGGNCPAMPSSFTRRDVPAQAGDPAPLATVEVPTEAADVESDAIGISAEFDIGTVRAEASLNEGTSVQDAAEDGMEDVTGEFDVPDGSMVQSGSESITEELLIHVPSGSDVVTVRLTATGPGMCIDALVAIRDRMANSVALA